MTDFNIHTFIRTYACGNRGWFVFRLLETPSSNNGVMGAPPDALVKGARIGPRKSFYGGEGVMAFATRLCQMTDSGGNWLHAQDRHLGMKFRIHGKVHYGWARLSVTPPHGFLHTGFSAVAKSRFHSLILIRGIIAWLLHASEGAPRRFSFQEGQIPASCPRNHEQSCKLKKWTLLCGYRAHGWGHKSPS